MSDDDLTTRLNTVVHEVIRYTTTSERIRASMVETRNLILRLGEMGTDDPELGPEIVAASEFLGEAAAALARAHQFADARLQTRLERALT